MAEKKVTLCVNGEDLQFNVTSEDFNRFVNETVPNDKILPAKRFLRRALADSGQRDALDDICDRGFTMQLATELVQEFQGEVVIEVKK